MAVRLILVDPPITHTSPDGTPHVYNVRAGCRTERPLSRQGTPTIFGVPDITEILVNSTRCYAPGNLPICAARVAGAVGQCAGGALTALGPYPAHPRAPEAQPDLLPAKRYPMPE